MSRRNVQERPGGRWNYALPYKRRRNYAGRKPMRNILTTIRMAGCLIWLMCGVSPGADSKPDPRADVTAALAKVVDAGNYSWSRVTDDTASGGGTLVETGKTDTAGYTLVDLNSGDLYLHVALKGGSGVINAGQGWKSAEDLADQGRAVRAVARIIRGIKSPIMVAREVISKAPELKREADTCKAEFTGTEAMDLLAQVFDVRGRDMTNPTVGVEFSVREGVLTRYEVRAAGTVSRQGVDTQVVRTITVELSSVGSTKVEVPDEAKAKLGGS